MKAEGRGVLAAAAFAGVVGATALSAAGMLEPDAWLLAASFALLNAVGLPLPRGDSIRINGGLLVASVTVFNPLTIVVTYLLGASVGRFLATRDGFDGRIGALEFATRALLIGLSSYGWKALVELGILVEVGASGVIGLFALGLLFMLAEIGLSSVEGRHRQSRGPAVRNLVRILGGGYMAQVSVGAVLALVYPRISAVAFAVLVALMLIMQHTTTLLLRVRSAYMRTVTALVRVTEMQDATGTGHSERVAELSSLLGRGLGLGSAELERLAYAALLHDIGHLDASLTSTTDRAEAGAQMVSQVSFLASLAPVIRKVPLADVQHLDRQGQDGLLARIIRVVSDFDDAVVANGVRASGATALETLRGKTDGVYDPRILHELARVVGRARGAAR